MGAGHEVLDGSGLGVALGGHLLDDVIHCHGRTFLHTFDGGTGCTGLLTEGLGSGGGECPTEQAGEGVEESSPTVHVLATVSFLGLQHLFIGVDHGPDCTPFRRDTPGASWHRG